MVIVTVNASMITSCGNGLNTCKESVSACCHWWILNPSQVQVLFCMTCENFSHCSLTLLGPEIESRQSKQFMVWKISVEHDFADSLAGEKQNLCLIHSSHSLHLNVSCHTIACQWQKQAFFFPAFSVPESVAVCVGWERMVWFYCVYISSWGSSCTSLILLLLDLSHQQFSLRFGIWQGATFLMGRQLRWVCRACNRDKF